MNIFLHQCSYQHCSEEPKSRNNQNVHLQMDKQNTIYTYNGILFSLEYKWNSNTFCPMDEPRKQVKQASHTKKILHASIYMRYIEYSYSLRQKVEGGCQGPRGGRNWGVSAWLGCRVSGLWDGGDGSTTLQMYLLPLKCPR